MNEENEKNVTEFSLPEQTKSKDGDKRIRGNKEKRRETRKMKKEEAKRKKEENRLKKTKFRKDKRKQPRSITEKFVYMVFFVMIVILAMMTISLICINCNQTGTAGTEGTLLSTGIAIIGVAIAVWAGLNIIQVLEKDKFELLGKEVANYRDERKILNRTMFFENLATEKNELNQYIYEKLIHSIDMENDVIPAEFYFELNAIETMFQLVYKEQMLPKRTLLAPYYDEAILKCMEQKKQAKINLVNNKFVEQYLKIRVCEFYFYKGYVDKEEAGNCFQNVINGFYEIFDELKEPKKMVEENAYINENSLLTVYMLNTIGEAYSKIIQSCGEKKMKVTEYVKMQGNKAEEYYEALILLIEKVQDKRMFREVYYRNYGVALERIDRYIYNNSSMFIHERKIQELYQKAINIVMSGYDDARRKTFEAWLSFYVKVMSKNCIRTILKGGELKYNLKEDIEKLIKYTDDSLFYAEIALRMFPMFPLFRRCYAFVQRDLAIWEIWNGKREKVHEYIEELNKMVKEILVVENIRSEYEEESSFPDDYLKELIEDANRLQELIKGKNI